MVQVRVKRLHPLAKLPFYASSGAAGFDFYCLVSAEIPPGEWIDIPTGLAFEIPAGYEIQVRSRSGKSKEGLTVMNQPGTIDCDYRGEVRVMMLNHTSDTQVIKQDERFAQGVIAPVIRATFDEVEELAETERGEGRFGSTGRF